MGVEVCKDTKRVKWGTLLKGEECREDGEREDKNDFKNKRGNKLRRRKACEAAEITLSRRNY